MRKQMGDKYAPVLEQFLQVMREFCARCRVFTLLFGQRLQASGLQGKLPLNVMATIRKLVAIFAARPDESEMFKLEDLGT